MMQRKRSSDKRDLTQDQRRLSQNLVALGDVTVSAVRARKIDTALQGLEFLWQIFDRFLQIKDNNPRRFSELLYTPKYLDRLEDETDKLGQMFAVLGCEEHQIPVAEILTQLARTHEAAIDRNVGDCSRETSYILVKMLRRLAEKPGNESLVQHVLDGLRIRAIWAAEKGDVSMYSTCIHWYTALVFPHDSRPFHLAYLNAVNKSFFLTARYLVDIGQWQSFRELVRHFHHSHLEPRELDSVGQYSGSLLMLNAHVYSALEDKISSELRSLEASQNQVCAGESSLKWLQQFNKVHDSTRAAFSENLQEVDELAVTVRRFVEDTVKFKAVRELFLRIGAYCLFKRRYDYLTYMWDFSDPHDADAHWVDSEIIPHGVEALFELYFGADAHERDSLLWEDHHGASLYFDRYFILLLMRALGHRRTDAVGEPATPGDIIHTLSSPSRIYSVTRSAESLIAVAQDLADQQQLAEALNFEGNILPNIMEKSIIPYFRDLISVGREFLDNTERKKSPDASMLEGFRTGVQRAFKEKASIRTILRRFDAYSERLSHPAPESAEKIYIGTQDSKAAFFEDWHCHFSGWGEHYGTMLAKGENQRLASAISKRSVDFRDGIHEAVTTFGSPRGLVLMCFNTLPLNWLRNQGAVDWDRKGGLEVDCVRGTLNVAKTEIPICLFPEIGKPETLLVDLGRFINLVQYDPEGIPLEPPIVRCGELIISVKALSEDTELLEKHLDTSEGSSPDEQLASLQKRVLIAIAEIFELQMAPDFRAVRFLNARDS